MKKAIQRLLAIFLALTLVLGPRMVQLALAQDNQDAASDEEIQSVHRLAQNGYLGDKKDFYLSAKSLTDDDVTDALLKINDQLSSLDLKSLQPGDKTYRLEDLQVLLTLVKDKAEDIRARKVSAWKFEKRVEKMIEILNPVAAAAPVDTPAISETATVQGTPSPKPTATETPVPGPSHADWEEMKGDLKDLSKKTGDMLAAYDQKMETMQKTNEDAKAVSADTQEQLKLVKKLLDQVQGDLNKTNDRLDQVAQKASEKSITDTELEQELTIMHKDLRDDTQDVSILKEEVAKLDKSGEEKGQSPLDDFLNSKWLAGGALVVGLTALVISIAKK